MLLTSSVFRREDLRALVALQTTSLILDPTSDSNLGCGWLNRNGLAKKVIRLNVVNKMAIVSVFIESKLRQTVFFPKQTQAKEKSRA
jgi:hypothetical protein